ncbi:MAG: excinuclease ABC subunit UvrC [Candidatus Schekmanbacteria bacterium]|nr:MAG: excinuclease ABC subunit UvrC [Candidatus Schekmanbacteria bacterium]
MQKPRFDIFPDNPGIYKFINKSGNIIYVGKAKNLRKRVASYFNKNQNVNPRLRFLLKDAFNIEFIVTNNEVEALILENNLIKMFKPKYNVRLRDDKQYPYLKITVKDEFPRLHMVRKIKDDGALYYGPYTSVMNVKEVMKIIMKIFNICTCKKKFVNNMKPCLNYQMKMCSAPCANMVGKDEYMELVEGVKLLLEGKMNEVIQILKNKMTDASDKMMYEKAAFYRDGIESIRKFSQKQNVSMSDEKDKDCIILRTLGTKLIFLILKVRDGKIIDQKDYVVSNCIEESEKDSLEAFIKQYYRDTSTIPSEILTEESISDAENISLWLLATKGKKVKIISPKRGKKYQILKMASVNADYILENRLREEEAWRKTVSAIQKKFAMDNLPECIDAVDISNIAGNQSVGAVIRWEEGKFKKEMYRRYSIKWKEGIDDFAMIEEVVSRHLARLYNEGKKLPSLLLIDGGKGQVNSAVKVVSAKDEYRDIFVVGLSKGRRYKRNSKLKPKEGFSTEEVVFHNRSNPLRFRNDSSELFLLQSIRDEVHRFAIQYHRKLRIKKMRESILDKVEGIGKARKMLLLKTFGSVDAIAKYSSEEIAEKSGLPLKIADDVLKVIQESLSQSN